MPGQIARGSKAVPVALMDDDGNYLGSAANPLQIAGGGGGGGGGAVTIADGADVAEGATTAAAYTDTTGAAAGTVVGLLKGLYSSFRTVGSTFSVIVNQLTATENVGLSTFGRATTSGGGSANLGVLNYGVNPATNQQVFIRGDANGSFAVSKGSSTLTTAQISVATTSTQVVAARANRGSVKITNLGTTDVFIGNTGVTTTTGDLLPGTKGASITVPTNAAVFAVASGAAQTVSVMEVY